MTEENKVHCCQCGKTIAVETETEVQIKCTGKYEGRKCGCINSIKKVNQG